jgi:hypothetical protein
MSFVGWVECAEDGSFDPGLVPSSTRLLKYTCSLWASLSCWANQPEALMKNREGSAGFSRR